jgi:Family of unknown function (DUF6011)
VTTEQTSPAKCLRPGCGRKLTAPASIAAGYGPVCRRRIREAAADIEVPDVKPEQHAKAVELIEAGGLVPSIRPGVFFAVSSDGSTTYITDTGAGTCTCKAGERGRRCYHLIAAGLVDAATSRRAA